MSPRRENDSFYFAEQTGGKQHMPLLTELQNQNWQIQEEEAAIIKPDTTKNATLTFSASTCTTSPKDSSDITLNFQTWKKKIIFLITKEGKYRWRKECCHGKFFPLPGLLHSWEDGLWLVSGETWRQQQKAAAFFTISDFKKRCKHIQSRNPDEVKSKNDPVILEVAAYSQYRPFISMYIHVWTHRIGNLINAVLEILNPKLNYFKQQQRVKCEKKLFSFPWTTECCSWLLSGGKNNDDSKAM